MKKQIRLYQVDSFTRTQFAGNPAGVVPDAAGLSERQMQQIAREMNNSETAFVLPGRPGEYDVQVRFFTPTAEVPICGHATIAAHYVRAKELGLSDCTVLQKTGAGILPVGILPEGEDLRVVMTQGEISFGPELPEQRRGRIAAALGLTPDDLRPDCPLAMASTGHSKIMVGIRRTEVLHALAPDMSALTRLSGEIGCNGYYVFTLHPGETPLAHGRMFAPAIGIPEDPVTGNANGSLGAYLVHHGLSGEGSREFSFEIVQGEAIGRAGTMRVCVTSEKGEPVRVTVSWNARIVYKTCIEVEI